LACEIGTHVAGDARPKFASTIREERRVFKAVVKQRFGHAPVAEIRRIDVQDFVDRQTKRAPGRGRQARDVIRQLLSYAVRLGLIECNPAIGVGAAKAPPRERTLSDDEIRML
jgi:hypothetical protein